MNCSWYLSNRAQCYAIRRSGLEVFYKTAYFPLFIYLGRGGTRKPWQDQRESFTLPLSSDLKPRSPEKPALSWKTNSQRGTADWMSYRAVWLDVNDSWPAWGTRCCYSRPGGQQHQCTRGRRALGKQNLPSNPNPCFSSCRSGHQRQWMAKSFSGTQQFVLPWNTTEKIACCMW